MILGRLQGYNEITKEYIDGQGQITGLPKSAFCVSATLPVDYDDFGSTPEAWDVYGKGEIGSNDLGGVVGFKDWMSLRTIILPLITGICGTDYSNFDSLNSQQQIIALKYFPTKIIAAQGFTFFATKSGGVDAAYGYINNYLTESEKARTLRYTNYMSFGYQYLGALQGLKAESLLRSLFLDVTYIKRGVTYIQTDGIDGLGDWTSSDDSFVSTGLKAKIVSGEFVLGGGMDVTTFINTLIGIIVDGIY
jgi:hypothetical protein